ncbi:hypothetical protein [Streptomyces chiangmaiensis]|uniref:Secreted protein n=1 Tax=Streptomyces chiangmaiensis TaxID=766497 RepID=A0ABU7FG38_9ACTN|nr:hypothetical protein [Streptomyces chiangmaiensis]MED7823101.1 hypothetical protein [Streptomyces chiangmaiensis]
MNKMIKRASIALASAAMAGGALLGAGGSASAATAGPVEHAQSSIAAVDAGHGRDGLHADWSHLEHGGVQTASSHYVSAERWYLDQLALFNL